MDIRKVKTKEDVENIVKTNKDKVIFLKFEAEWCGPCRVYGDNLKGLPANAWSNLIVLTADVEEAEDLAIEYGVRSIPKTVFFYNGIESENSRVGLMTKEDIINQINNLMA